MTGARGLEVRQLEREVAGIEHDTVGQDLVAGGVELLTLSVWRSPADVPEGVDEAHGLLVARETVASSWRVVEAPRAVARAA